MKKNIGTLDKTLRLSAAGAIGLGIWFGGVSGTTALALGAVAIALVGTSLVSFCGLYTILGISTCKVAR